MLRKWFILISLFLIILNLNTVNSETLTTLYDVADLHNDILINLLQDRKYLTQNKPGQQMSFEAIKAGNYKLLTFALWLPDYFFDKKAKKPGWIKGEGWDELCKKRFQKRALLKHCLDTIKEAFSGNEDYILLSIEGMHMVDSIEDVRWLYENGVRVFGLAWNEDNVFAHSHNKREGLTEKGKELVRDIVKWGGTIDVSHSSQAAIFDVIEVTEGKCPIIASHSGAKGISDHSRNLSDEAIRAIAKTGGVVGVPFYKAFLTEKKGNEDKLDVSTEEVLDTIDYIAKITSVDNVAIGSDYGMIIPPPGLENAGHIQKLAIGLLNRGYSPDSVKKIMSGNVFRVLRKILN